MKVFMSEYSIHQKSSPGVYPARWEKDFPSLLNISSQNVVIQFNTKKKLSGKHPIVRSRNHKGTKFHDKSGHRRELDSEFQSFARKILTFSAFRAHAV